MITPAKPWMVSRTTACHTRSVSVMKRSAHAAEATMKSAWPICMRRRQSYRSASAPAHTEKSRNGTQWLITAKPARAGEWNARKMTQ